METRGNEDRGRENAQRREEMRTRGQEEPEGPEDTQTPEGPEDTLQREPRESNPGTLQEPAAESRGHPGVILQPKEGPSCSLQPGWSLSFAGCGFHSLYYVGALCCLLQRAPQLVLGASRFSGASSGSLVAAALAVDISLTDLCSDLVAIAAEARLLPLSVFHPSFSLLRRVRDSLQQVLPEDAHQRATGRLCVSLTRIRDRASVMVTEFGSREELIQVLLCSCFFPVYCGFFPPTFRGEYYMDGALSNNQPLFEFRNTVTFAPFSGESDICPQEDGFSLIQFCFGNVSIEVNTGNVYRVWTSFMPHPPQVLTDMWASGYSDAFRFLRSSGVDGVQRQSPENGINALRSRDMETLLQDVRTVLASAHSGSALRPSYFSKPPLGAKALGIVLDLVLVLVRLVLFPLRLLLHFLLRLCSSVTAAVPTPTCSRGKHHLWIRTWIKELLDIRTIGPLHHRTTAP